MICLTSVHSLKIPLEYFRFGQICCFNFRIVLMNQLPQCFSRMSCTANNYILFCNMILYCVCQNIPTGKDASSK